MADNFVKMNPLYGVYSDFQKILNTVVIKYSYLAEKYETFDIKKEADLYILCREKKDTFFTYRDYTEDELKAVGIKNDSDIIKYTSENGCLEIPVNYREALLLNRRNHIIENYDEKNDYYRKLNGYPPLDTNPKNFYYVPKKYADQYEFDSSIPLHRIQDHYNNIDDVSGNRGDLLISIIEGLGLITELKQKNPKDEYLNFIGRTRIDIVSARKAKNFQLLYANQTTVSNMLYDEFVRMYEQARDYHVSAIFVREHRDVIPYYDQFIAMCIMCMTLELVINKQFKLGIDRKYYNNYTLNLLYDAYGIPYNSNIDEYTQRSIAQSINKLIQEKSTDSVFNDIKNILGFNDLNIYRYYLTKERKFDIHGAPIFATTEKFNSDTGEIETVPDYEKMYDVYFQKVSSTDTDFIASYNNKSNIAKYDEVTGNDPFWWNDENIVKSVWETDYNFVEAKYLSLGVSYKMTDIMYETILLLKFLLKSKDDFNAIVFTLPKINEHISVTLYDAIILLFCLMSKKHHIRGEIISIPTQVTSVLDYLHNTDGEGCDDYLVNTFDFDFSLLKGDNAEGQTLINDVKHILDPDEAEKFDMYIKSLSLNDLNESDKVTIINRVFTDIKGLSKYLQYLMAKASDKKTYDMLKGFYNAAFYSKEVKSLFTIQDTKNTVKRTAKNFFEYLYHYNYNLYSTLFTEDYERQYEEYIKFIKKNPSDYTLEQFIHDVEYGSIGDLESHYNTYIQEKNLDSKEYTLVHFIQDVNNGIVDIEYFEFSYSTLKNTDDTVEDDLLYYYIDHIISRMDIYIDDLKHVYNLNDVMTPLEDLLIKLVNFFKSFTVDMLGLDIMYILDMRAENTMKLIAEIASVTKDIEIDDNLHTSYADVIHSLMMFIYDNNDQLSFTDKVLYNAYIDITKKYRGDRFNEILFDDFISYINKTIELSSKASDVGNGRTVAYDDVFQLLTKLLYLGGDDLRITDNLPLIRTIITLAKTRLGDRFNDLVLSDELKDMISYCDLVSNPLDNILSFTDIACPSTSVRTTDKPESGQLFTDKIAHKYYSA